MKKTLKVVAIVLAVVTILSGCSFARSDDNDRFDVGEEIGEVIDFDTSRGANSPEKVITNYLSACKDRDAKAAMACAGIVWNDSLFDESWSALDAFEGYNLWASNIRYEEDPDPNFDSDAAIRAWFEQAANRGLELEYTYEDIMSYGVVSFEITVSGDGETETMEAALDVIETSKGWFLISIDTAR